VWLICLKPNKIQCWQSFEPSCVGKGICKKPKEKFGITCVYSIDNPFSSADVCPSAGLRCGGYGSAVVVTSSFAMVAVAEVLKKLDAKKPKT
jgi:tRNA A37 threonylcarbamoyladenosine dehydratase